jgi:hypothetical protein
MRWEDEFGTRPADVRLVEAERVRLEYAKDLVLSNMELAVVDHQGKRMNERKWRWAMGLVGGL